MKQLFSFIALIIALNFSLNGANFKDQPTTIKQPDGTVINCLNSGDEFFNYIHDEYGYTIIQGQDGWYYYAVKDNYEQIIPSTYKVGTINPDNVNLQKFVKLTKNQYQEKVNRYFAPLKDNSKGGTYNIGKAPSSGTFNNLVVYIRFADDPAFSNNRQTYIDLFTGTGGATYSVQEYFTSVSYNQMLVNATHFPDCAPTTNISFQDAHNRGYFQPYNATTNTIGYQDDTEARLREHQLLVDAVNFTKTEIEATLPANEIDLDSDGYVDNMSFIIYGDNDAWSDLLWAHRWALYTYNVSINGKRVWDYTFQPETQCTARTTCHELFHCMGSPDLYHYTDNGVDPCWYWDLMEYGSGSMTAYMKEQIGGWITIPSISTSGSYSLSPLAGSTNNAYKIALPNSTTEFLILEFRKKTGPVEAKLTASADEGLLIYRINTNVTIDDGNRNGPPDMLWVYRPNGDTNNNGTPGDATFSSTQGRTSFSDVSNPALLLSDDATWGGISITNIGAVGSTISFNVTFPSSGYNVTFNVTDGTNPVSGANVTFNSTSQLTNASGITTFTSVSAGNNLAYSVAKTGYTTSNGTVNVINTDVTKNVVLASQTATNLAVQGTPTANTATLIWSGSGATNYQIQYYIQGTTNYFFQTANSSPYTLQALEPNSIYCCRIRTNLSGTYTSYSSIVTFTTSNGSSILATNLAVQGTPTANAATLTWTGSGATSYQIQYYINGSTNYYLQTAISSPFTLNALEPNTIYNCRIRTYSGGIYSSYSPILSFTTANGTSILASNLAVQGTPTANAATLTWNGSGATSYQIQYYINGTTNYNIQTVASSPFTLNALEPNTTYNCRIRTYSGGTYTSYSPIISFTTANGTSILATNLSVQGTPTTTTCSLTWNGNGANSYQIIYYKTGTTNYNIRNFTSSPALLTSLLPNTNYECRIRTYSGGTYTSYSPTLTFSTAASFKNDVTNEPLLNYSPITEAIIYPNPATSFYNLDFSSETNGQINFSIFNIDGKLCETKVIEHQKGINHFVFETPKLSSGLYFIILNKNDFNFQLKLIVK
ncbi:MAG: fibronectin type III domain-containing protein [Bacteroidia bacterium]|nr:fibronectin type III domain-containing protein [Bacteroidia bacterium]